MAQAQHISSFMISRATWDQSRMPLRPSEHMWQRHSLRGFPTLLMLLSSSSCWQRVGGGPWPLQIGIAKGPGWSTLTILCPTWFLVSQTPCHCWWGVPHPAPHGWNKLKKEVAMPPECQPHSQEGDPQDMPCKGWHREFGKNITALCVEQPTTLHGIACTDRLSVYGIRSI